MKPVITKDIYEIVTRLIIQKLEEGVIPWRKPWRNLGPPRNLVTQRPYRGVNFILLNALQYPSNEFLTFKQVQDLGGRIKKGEHGTLVILWIWIDEQDARKMQDVQPRKRPMLRYYFVFNASQCTGIPERAQPLPELASDTLARCEGIIKNMPEPPKIVHNEHEAYYHPLADYINMPKLETFESKEGYYSCLYHEIMHYTGHETRLNRKELMEATSFGSDLYSIEELTAEIGTCYLSSIAGIAVNDLSNNVAYIKGWLKRLKEDRKFIVYASAQAQRAVDYILNIKHEENEFTDTLNMPE